MGELLSLDNIKIESVEDNILIELRQIKLELGRVHYNMQSILIVESQRFRGETQYFSFGSKDYFDFLSGLSNMYFDLKGKTEISSYDYPGNLTITVIERGYFLVEGFFTKQYSINNINSENTYKFKFALNQSYFKRVADKYKGINSENWKDYFDFSR